MPSPLQGRGYEGLPRSEEHTSELQSLMRIPYAVFCLKKKKTKIIKTKLVHNKKLNVSNLKKEKKNKIQTNIKKIQIDLVKLNRRSTYPTREEPKHITQVAQMNTKEYT